MNHKSRIVLRWFLSVLLVWLIRTKSSEGKRNRINSAYVPRSEKEDDMAVTQSDTIYYPV